METEQNKNFPDTIKQFVFALQDSLHNTLISRGVCLIQIFNYKNLYETKVSLSCNWDTRL